MDNSASESEIVLISLDFSSQHLVALQVHLVRVEKASAGALPLHLEDIVECGIKALDKREIRI